jgi:hypothetical protein
LVEAALIAGGLSVVGGPSAPGANFGPPLEPWEVESLAALEASHVRFPVADLGTALTSAVPHLTTSGLDSAVVRTVLAAANASSPGTEQSLGQLLVDLGQTPLSGPFTPTGAGAVSFDGVQYALLLRSLATALAQTAVTHGATPPPGGGAATAKGALSRALAPAGTAGGNLECNLSSGFQFGSDIAGYAAGGFWNKLTDVLEEKGFGLAGAWNKVLSGAGILLTYANLIVTFMVLKMEVKLDAGGRALDRTTNSTPGEQRTITATARYDTGNLQVVNCVHAVLNEVGLDFSVPQTGPVSEGSIYFRGLSGFEQPSGLVEFALQPGQQGLVVPTDENGEASVVVEGQAVKPPLPSDAVAVTKQAEIELAVRPKRPSLKNDLVDILGSAVAVLTDPTSVLSVPAQLVLRSHVFAATLFDFPVVDHRADYEVNYTVPGTNMTLTGHKCGGPGGTWNINVGGAIGPMDFTGQLGLDMSAYSGGNNTYSATVAGVQHTSFSEGSVDYSAETTYKGTGHLEPGQLVVTLTGTTTGNLSAPGVSMPVAAPFDGTHTIPVTIGDFSDVCDD